MTRMLVFGGTGKVGRLVVADAVARGYEVGVIARRTVEQGHPAFVEGASYHAIDLLQPASEQLASVLDGVDVVVDTLNGVSPFAQRIFRVGSHAIVEAAERAGVERTIVLSMVHCNESTMGYYEAKVEQEGIYLDSSIATTVVRTTLFHSYTDELFAMVRRFGFIPAASGAILQPVDGRDVARLIVDTTADRPPHDEFREIGGPELLSSQELASRWKTAVGARAPIVTVPLFGSVGRFLRTGLAIVPENRDGTVTFGRWLDEKYQADVPALEDGRPHA